MEILKLLGYSRRTGMGPLSSFHTGRILSARENAAPDTDFLGVL